MASIELKGREIPLLYTMMEMKQVQEEIAPVGKYLQILFGRTDKDDENATAYGSAEHLNTVGKSIRILGNAGLEEAGETPDLTDKWVMRSLKPANLMKAMSACLEAINEGMESEIPEQKTDEPVDVTLEQIKKKKEKDG